MEKNYPILLGDEQIGDGTIQQQGLYWRIRCSCKLTGQVVYRVVMCCEHKEADLGILVPVKGNFEIETSVPVKRIGTGPFVLRAVPRHKKAEGLFMPIYPDEPFAYLHRLKNAYLQIREGSVGIILPETADPAQARRDNGQSQEPHGRSAQQ